MQKKKDKLLDKIVKKDYNNELEEILEKKYFEENVKSLLLNILYKVETAYKDYEKVKQDVETKEEYIENIISIIKDECDTIKMVRPNSEESQMLGRRTFLVEKKKKRIICYPIERKLLYCIAKIGKQDKIVKDEYFLLNQTLSDLINVGNNINMVEPLRDFNGYSWTTIPSEIESIQHNLIYQNLRILLGDTFLNNWIRNKEFIIDYMEVYKTKLEEKYGKEYSKKIQELVNKLSILIGMKFDSKLNEKIKKLRQEYEIKMNKIKDRAKFVQDITSEKKKLTEEIKKIDETINNKSMLQEEYEKRNETLPLEQKIFSARILSKKMIEEREEKIAQIEYLNDLMNPQKFVKYVKQIEERVEYLNIKEDIQTLLVKLQKLFLKCYKVKVEKAETRQDILKLVYEFRYYNLLPVEDEKFIFQVKDFQKELKEIGRLLIGKAQSIKLISKISKSEKLNIEILKNIFTLRIMDLEELYMKITKEKDKYYIQLFDENIFEEKIEISEMQKIDKKDIDIKLNKKIKIFS